jgi:hypothetical protein
MKTYGGSGCIDTRFVDLGTSWRWFIVIRQTPKYSCDHYDDDDDDDNNNNNNNTQ